MRIKFNRSEIIIAAVAVICAVLVGVILYTNGNKFSFNDVAITEITEEAPEQDYQFRILADRHKGVIDVYMPQMLFGGQWENMEKKWTDNIDLARDSIRREQKKQERRRGPRYVIVETDN